MKTAPLTLLLLAAPALAQAPDVAIVAAASASLSDCRYTDVQSALQASGLFNSVDIVDCTSTTPDLATLAPYEAVLTWSNVNYADSDLLGDVLADYNDAGGGVVVAVFANTTTAAARRLGGRWLTGGYEVVQTQQGNTNSGSTLGATLVPGHPLMAGVNTISASSAFRPNPTTTLVQGTVIAEWSDGAIIAAVGASPTRIDLGVYPPSSNCSAAFWEVAGDGAVLIGNALTLAASATGGIGTNYCTAVANSTGAPAAISATGSTSAAQNDVTLSASSLPAQAFGFFLTSRDQGSVVNPGGSQGDLCLGGAIGRFVGPGQIQNSGATGEISLALDLASHPTPTGLVPVVAGDTWHFQAWFRDSIGGSATSNFTDGLTIDFN